jgi:hypothetical protein
VVIAFVLITEMINTAIEATLDISTPDGRSGHGAGCCCKLSPLHRCRLCTQSFRPAGDSTR